MISGWWKLVPLLFVILSPARENPEYGWWSEWKIGAWTLLSIEGEIQGRPFVLYQTHTLLEMTPDRAIVSRVGTMQIGEEKFPATKDRDEILRNAPNALNVEQEGDENLMLAEVETFCHWLEGTDPRTHAKVKMWISPRVPGGVVQAEIRAESASSVTRIHAITWAAK